MSAWMMFLRLHGKRNGLLGPTSQCPFLKSSTKAISVVLGRGSISIKISCVFLTFDLFETEKKQMQFYSWILNESFSSSSFWLLVVHFLCILLQSTQVQVQCIKDFFSAFSVIRAEAKAQLNELITCTKSSFPIHFSNLHEPKFTELFSYFIRVRPIISPKISHQSSSNRKITTQIGENATFYCGYEIQGEPQPQVFWFKSGQEIKPTVIEDLQGNFYEYSPKFSNGNKTLHLIATLLKTRADSPQHSDDSRGHSVDGEYECKAVNSGGVANLVMELLFDKHDSANTSLIVGASTGAVALIAVILICGIIYYHKWKLSREKRKYEKILDTFKMGDPKGLEALRRRILLDQGIENVSTEECTNLISVDMAEFQKAKNARMLPYDEDKWEVAFDKLVLKETLGEGQFGKVVKAKWQKTPNESLTVAVKTLHSNPEKIAVENLMSELKVMIHLGSHHNIVNVLGACTSKLPKQELYAIVEYCEHGDIGGVLKRYKSAYRRKTLQIQRAQARANRESLTSQTPTKQRFSSRTISTNSSNFNCEDELNMSNEGTDVFVSEESARYRPMHALASRARTDTIKEKLSLTMSKLISWSAQVANGMEYLASKKVVHGDLACRYIISLNLVSL